MLSNAYFLAKFRFDTAENEPAKICKTSPLRDRVAELRGPSEGLGGGCALLGCTAASRASVEQPIGTSRSSRSKGELVQFEMIQSD